MPFICPICGAVLPDLGVYYFHAAMEHAGLPIPPPMEAFPPPPPPAEVVPTPPAEIVPTPTPEVPTADVYTCPVCGAVFLSEMEVREHQAVEHAGIPPAPPVATPGTEVEAMAQYRNIGDLSKDPAMGGVIGDAVRGMFKAVGLSPEDLQALAHSSVDPAEAAQKAQLVGVGFIAALSAVYTIGVVAEAASLGQVESITHAITGVSQILGLSQLVEGAWVMPFDEAVMKPARQHWASIFTPEIPGSGDLIRMVVREVLTPTLFKVYMARQGFSSTWSDAYWEAHWVLPARTEIVDAYHRGLIDKAEYEKYIVWHDYKPEPRPGISKSDMEVLSGLMKELIPRVDLRRAWELGIIGDDRLLKGYQDLGYEDDAPLMVEIQKAISLGAERGAVARVAGRCYRDDKIPESRFREELSRMGIGGEAQDLWVLRFQWEKIAKPTKAEEQAEEVTGGTAGEVPT